MKGKPQDMMQCGHWLVIQGLCVDDLFWPIGLNVPDSNSGSVPLQVTAWCKPLDYLGIAESKNRIQ